MMAKRARVPFIITSLRLLSLPFLLIFLYLGEVVPFLVLFSLAIFTDHLDGHLARKFGVATRGGAYYDSLVDFGLVLSILLLLTWQERCPHWVPSLIIISFSLFLITSRNRTLMYDSIGRYFGGFLFGTIFLMVAMPSLDPMVHYSIAMFFTVSLASRIAYLFYHSSSGPRLVSTSLTGIGLPDDRAQD